QARRKTLAIFQIQYCEANHRQADSRNSRSLAASLRAASARDQFQRRQPGLWSIGLFCSICEASAQRCAPFRFGRASISSGTASALKDAAYAASKARPAIACSTFTRAISLSGLRASKAPIARNPVATEPKAKRSRRPLNTVTANQIKTTASHPIKTVV